MSTKVKVVNLQGSVTLSTVESLSQMLRDSIDEKPMVLASLSQTEDIDLAGVQLLYAARRYARAAGKAFHLTGSVPEVIAMRLFRSGFVSSVIRDGKQLDEELHEFDLPSGTTPEDAADA